MRPFNLVAVYNIFVASPSLNGRFRGARSAPLAPAGERLRNPEAGPKASYKGLQHIYGVGFFEVPVRGRKITFKKKGRAEKVRDAARPMVSPDFTLSGWKLDWY